MSIGMAFLLPGCRCLTPRKSGALLWQHSVGFCENWSLGLREVASHERGV